jgi:hypothetical protein
MVAANQIHPVHRVGCGGAVARRLPGTDGLLLGAVSVMSVPQVV